MHLTTIKGYGFFECSSAFQKAIRRNDEDNALYFGVELFNSGYDEYAWKRMKIITSEDVGLAEPHLPANIYALYQMYNDAKSKKSDKLPERVHFIHAIMLLCRCAKSRLVDWTMIAMWRDNGDKKPIPDYAYDMHNRKGKSMGRGIQWFYDESTQLVNHEIQPREQEFKDLAYKLHIAQPTPLLPNKKLKGTSNDLFSDNEEQ